VPDRVLLHELHELHDRNGEVAVEVVKRAGPSSAYLMDSHATERYLDEMWMPQLFERSGIDAWLNDEGDKLADLLAGG
jgi:trimethylamine:corrinoid methyltransferase-like protein